MNRPFKVVIPARYASTRLPGKPLLPIAGKAMVLHVCEKAMLAGADEVIVATDSPLIADQVNARDYRVVMTSTRHNSGTERIAEVAKTCGWQDDTVIVNLQGDEPLVPAHFVKTVATALSAQNKAGIATLAVRIQNRDEIANPNIVKVIVNKPGYAQYFSRAPIPWNRDEFPEGLSGESPIGYSYLRHIGIYAYTAAFIRRYIAWPVSEIEQLEKLEQLRILWQGDQIRVVEVKELPGAGVDTRDDLMRVERILSEQTVSPSAQQ